MEMEESRWRRESEERSWAALPVIAVEMIMRKLSPIIFDLFRFRCVCRHWYFSLPKLGSGFPFLIVPKLETTCQIVRFSSSSSNTASTVYYLLNLPKEKSSSINCSQDYHGLNHMGWFLVINSGVMSSPFLFNPVTLSRISLPPLPFPTIWNECYNHPFSFRHDDPPPPNTTAETDDDHYLLGPEFYMPSLTLAVLSSNPSSSNFVDDDFEVMVVHGWDSRLAFSHPRSQTKTWTTIVRQYYDHQPLQNTMGLAFFGGRFYAVDGDHDALVCCDTSSAMATMLLPLPVPQWNKKENLCFLVASDDELLLVIRHFFLDRPAKFLVFKLVEEQRQLKWLQVKSIGHKAIFISKSNSCVVSALTFLDVYPGCIYYSDLSLEGEYRSKTSLKVLIHPLTEDTHIKELTVSLSSFLCFWQSMWFYPTLP